ncbi:MAG: hypothetical protein ACREDS_05695, partial [Limisphaerales bacterium]
ALRLLLISSQVPLTTQPPFQPPIFIIIGSRPINWENLRTISGCGQADSKITKNYDRITVAKLWPGGFIKFVQNCCTGIVPELFFVLAKQRACL